MLLQNWWWGSKKKNLFVILCPGSEAGLKAEPTEEVCRQTPPYRKTVNAVLTQTSRAGIGVQFFRWIIARR